MTLALIATSRQAQVRQYDREGNKTLVKFRKTKESDLDRVMNILADGRASLAALGIDQWQGGYPHRGVIEADVARGESFVAVDDNAVVFATTMIGLAGEPIYDTIEGGLWLTSSMSHSPRYGVIHRVAVSASQKGQGAGTFLLASAERITSAQGYESVRVDTHPGNLPMQRLLEKQGYTRCGIVHIVHAEKGTPERIAYEKVL